MTKPEEFARVVDRGEDAPLSIYRFAVFVEPGGKCVCLEASLVGAQSVVDDLNTAHSKALSEAVRGERERIKSGIEDHAKRCHCPPDISCSEYLVHLVSNPRIPEGK